MTPQVQGAPTFEVYSQSSSSTGSSFWMIGLSVSPPRPGPSCAGLTTPPASLTVHILWESH